MCRTPKIGDGIARAGERHQTQIVRGRGGNDARVSSCPVGSQVSGTDVVIIGAGAAGLAAARLLQSRGIRFEVLEIGERIDGRADKDVDYFGVPVDLGCSEFRYAHLNPWISYARRNRYKLDRLPGDDAKVIFAGTSRAPPAKTPITVRASGGKPPLRPRTSI